MAAQRVVLDATVVVAVKAIASAVVLGTGFIALSDDDFARVVIAQTFAAAPRLDPSGTSWLPLPFWLQGGIMTVAGRDFAVARGTALALSLLAAVAVHRAALWSGASRKGALAGAVAACALPHAARLGVTTMPDAITAGLILLGAAATATPVGARRLLGAAALLAATLSRYEAWPVAAGFAALCARDAARQRLPLHGAAAAVALAGPIAWMTHGAITHGAPLFFLHRVAEYRQAAGAAPGSLWEGLSGYPRALLALEPELWLATGVLLLLGRGRGSRPGSVVPPEIVRPGTLLLLLLVFLIVGDLQDGAPTHHPGRPLLAIWLGLCVAAGQLLAHRLAAARGPAGRAVLAAALLSALGLGALLRQRLPAESFADRRAELEIGRHARAHVEPGARLLVDTFDFGYFAVIAAFARPEDARPFRDHDPRTAPGPDAFASPAELTRRLAGEHASWIVTHRQHAGVTGTLGNVVAENSRFLLLHVGRAANKQ